ncbi:hypothetical protein BaRGS_00020731 [Batillaria attramentaria]|uniref:RING-type domain-containing protein n=1 Tax=Batillaria attramentaria TaxID=370345 RepID=A0ABD0KM45_9CAEN
MASAGSQAFTACPRCHSLCVGNATLPCGHVICRKCVRRILQNEPKPTCPNCDCGIPRYQGQTIRQTIDQLDSDPVLEELVNEQLVRQSPSDCRKCDKMTATRVCLDCGCKDCGKCCGSCCARDHVVQDLASIAKNPKKAVTEPQAAAASQSCQRTASRKSELNSALRTLEELEEKLPMLLSVVKGDLEEKNQLLTRYQVSGALQSEEGSLAVRVNRLLDVCRPPCLDRLKEGVNTLLHPKHSRPIFPEGDIVGRYNTLIAQLHPKRVSEVTDRLPPHIEEVRKLNLFNVDVSVIGPEPPQEIREKEGTPPGPSSHDVHIDRCHDLTMEVHNITIHIGDRLAKLQVMTDTNIKAAVTDALVAKITWDEDRERKLRELRQQHIDELRREVGKVNEQKRKVEAELEEARQEAERVRQETKKLKTQLSEAKARGLEGEKYRKELKRRLQQAQERLRNAEIRVAILEQMLGEEKSKGDKRLADIIRLYEDKRRVEEQVMTFVIQVEEAHRQLLAGRHLDKQRLSDVIQRLFQQFNIRLLGADCGLRFLLDAPVSQWVKVVEKQMEVQAVLSDLIPEDARRAVAWAEVTPFGPSGEDIDLQIGRPLPVPDTFPATVSLV